MPLVEPALRGLAAILLATLSVYTAFTVARRLVGNGPVSVRWCGTGVVFLWMLLAVFRALAPFRSFTLTAALLVWVCLALIARLGLDAHGSSMSLIRDDGRRLAERVRQAALSRDGWLYAFGAAMFLFACSRALLCPPLAHDSLTYHLVLAGNWVQTGGAGSLAAPDAWSYYQYFPANGEVISAWLMLPLRGDGIVKLGNCLLWLLVYLTFYATACHLGSRPRHAAFGALVLAFTPAVFAYVVTAYVEIGLLAELLCVLLFLFRAIRSRRTGDVILTFMALGCALGTKLIALPVVAVGTVGLLIVVGGRGVPWSRRLGLIAGGLAIAGVVGVPWYLRAWIEQGSPLYPFPLQFFGQVIHAGCAAQVEMYAAKAAAFTEPWRIAVQLIKPFVPHSYTLGPVAVVCLLAAPIGALVTWRRGQRGATAILLLSFCAVVTGYYSGGMAGVRLQWPAISARFLTFPLAILLLWTVQALDRPGRLTGGLRLVMLGLCAMNLILLIPEGFAREELRIVKYAAALLGIVCATVGVAGWIAFRRGRRAVLGLTVALVAGTLIALPVLDRARNAVRHDFFANAYEIRSFPRHGAEVWRYCDRPEQPRRIAVTAGWDGTGHNWLRYPLLGSRLQNEVMYVPITSDGAVIDYADSDRLAASADFHSWLERLLREGVDVVVCLSPETFESRWIQRHEAVFTRVAGDDRAGAYAVNHQVGQGLLKSVITD